MRIAMLISGGGTTAAAIMKAVKDGQLKNVEPALIIASNISIPGIEKLRTLGFKNEDIVVAFPGLSDTKEEFGEKIIKACTDRGVNFIGQYGWMLLTPKNVIEKYQGMMVNQHPGPLDVGRPDFGGKGMYGMRVHAARLEFVRRTNREFWSEATAQRVAANFDEGMVVNSEQVIIYPGDTAQILQARMLPIEHKVQIKTLQDFANNNVTEVMRETPLVKPEEYPILEECKKSAIEKYPKG